MGIVQHQQDRALAESVGLIHVPLHLSAADIVGPMSTSYVTAVTQKGAGKIIVPEGPIVVIYTAGTVPFGGNPNLQIGYPGLPVAFVNSSAGISDTDSEGHIFQCGSIGSSLSDFINQPLVLSFADASAIDGDPQGNGSIDLSFYYRVLSLY